MNVVDSSGWIAFYGKGVNGPAFRPTIEAHDQLIVPSVAIYEVFKWMARERNTASAEAAVAAMMQGTVVDLDRDIAVAAAVLSVEHGLAMADAIMLATAQLFQATLWTQDADFKDLDGVHYIA